MLAALLSLGGLHITTVAAEPVAQRFDVPAGDAAVTLKQFAEQSAQQVVFMGDTVLGEKTRAVKGEFTPRAALDLMLADTRLVAVQDKATGALAVRKGAADPNAPGAAQPAASDAPAQRSPEGKPGSATGTEVDVVTLSPFEVTTEKEVGYESLNANSISGLNTSLLNVPVTAEIYNKQFMDDLAISSTADTLMEWASGQSPNGKPGNSIVTPGDGIGNTPFVVRGVASGPPRLDGFMNGGLGFLDDTFMERTEVIRGPQSLLYGTSNAGGIVNMVSKQSSFSRTSTRLRLRLNEFGTVRGELDANIVASPNFALRAALTRANEEFYTDFNNKEVNAWYMAAAYRPLRHTTFRVYGGVGIVDKHSGTDSNANVPGDPRSGQSLNLLLAQGNTAGLYFKSLDWSNVDSVAGDGSINHQTLTNLGVIADVGLASWLDLRVMGAYQGSSNFGTLALANSQGLLSPTATANTTGKWATGGRVQYNGGRFVQRGARVLLNSRFNFWRDRIRNNFTVGFDATRQLNDADNERYYLVDASGNFVVNAAQITNADAGRTQMPILFWSLEDGGKNPFILGASQYLINGNTYRRAPASMPGTVPPTTANPWGYNNAGSLPQNLVTWDRGYYSSLYSEWFNNRVSLMAGFRRNFRLLHSQNAPDDTPAVWASTWSAGAVVHVTDWLSPYYNYSLSYAPNTVTGVSQDGRIPVVNNGVGKELGLKFSIPRLKTTGSLALYRTDAVDRSTVLNNAVTGSQAIVDPPSAINGSHLSQSLIYFADFSVKGLEVSMTANPTRNWRARFSFSYNTDIVGNSVTLHRWYNDEFRTNAAGQVTFDNGTLAMVNSIAGNTSSPLIPLTVAMMKDPASGYFANLDPSSGRIRDLGGRSFAQLALVGRADGLTIGTGNTGLPITSHQLGWVPPTAEYIVTDGGDHLAIPRSTQSVTVTRSFTEGRLSGFTTGLTVVARQHQLAYYYIDKAAGNVRKARMLPDQVNTNLFLSYQIRLRSKYRWTSQVNVTNLMNHRDLVYILESGTGVPSNAKMNNVPRAWSWTNTVEF